MSDGNGGEPRVPEASPAAVRLAYDIAVESYALAERRRDARQRASQRPARSAAAPRDASRSSWPCTVEAVCHQRRDAARG